MATPAQWARGYARQAYADFLATRRDGASDPLRSTAAREAAALDREGARR